MLTSDFKPEVEIWPFRACAKHPARNSSFIVDVAMGQIVGYHVPQNVGLFLVST